MPSTQTLSEVLASASGTSYTNTGWVDSAFTATDSYADIVARSKGRVKLPKFELLSPINTLIPTRAKQLTKEEGVLGIEIENEFKNEAYYPRVKGWERVTDNSLRYFGFEYVSVPTRYTEYKKSLENLCKAISNTGETPTDSIRTSTHVHFDVNLYNFIEIINFASVYWILEDFLSFFAGKYRRGNLFCLRLKDADATLGMILSAIKKRTISDCYLLSNDYRYGSVNFAALKKFGTLEFRMMRGTFDFDKLTTWIDALERIRQYALKLESPRELHHKFVNVYDASEFASVVLGEELTKAFSEYITEDEGKLLRNGFSYVESLLLAEKDFTFKTELEMLSNALKEEEKRKEDLRKMILQFNNVMIQPLDVLEENILQVTDLGSDDHNFGGDY